MEITVLRVSDFLRTVVAEAAEANRESQSDYIRQVVKVRVKRVDPKYDRLPNENNITLTF